jgi:hypothetical protein
MGRVITGRVGENEDTLDVALDFRLEVERQIRGHTAPESDCRQREDEACRDRKGALHDS